MDREDDYRALMERFWPRLVRTACLLGSSPQDAEDQAQAALVRVYLGWDKVATASNSDAYVYRIFLNSRLTSLRSRWRTEVLMDVVESMPVPDLTDQVDLTVVLLTALQRLSVKHRQVVVLRYYLDLSEPQIAEVLDLPLGTVKSRLHRAQAQLQSDPSIARTPESEPS